MEDTALSSSKDIEAVREKVENGLLDPVLKKIEELCQSNNTAHIVLTGKVDDAVKEATNLGKRVDKLERVNWFPKWVDSTSKKILCGLVILLFYMAVNSLSNAVTWGLAKAMIFGERPGVMKIIFEEVKKPIEPGQKEVPK